MRIKPFFSFLAAAAIGTLTLHAPQAQAQGTEPFPNKPIHSTKNPGKVTYSSSGSMGITHLLGEIFTKDAGVKWNHIPFPGSAPAITAVLGGHVDMVSTAIGPAQAHIKAGTLRPLAVFADTRLKAYPEVN